MTWKNPKWTAEKKQWFMKLIESKVSNPDAANMLSHYGRFDLEVEIVVAPEDEHVFTARVIEDLTEQLGKATETMKPVVYLSGKPSREIEQLMYEKDHEL